MKSESGMSLQSTNESLAAENAQLQLRIERIRQETIEECAKWHEQRGRLSAPGSGGQTKHQFYADSLRPLTQGAPQHQAEQQEQSVHQAGGKLDGAVACQSHGSVPEQFRIDLDEQQADRLRDYIGQGDRPITLVVADGCSGYGLYALDTEYLDEGGDFIADLAKKGCE